MRLGNEANAERRAEGETELRRKPHDEHILKKTTLHSSSPTCEPLVHRVATIKHVSYNLNLKNFKELSAKLHPFNCKESFKEAEAEFGFSGGIEHTSVNNTGEVLLLSPCDSLTVLGEPLD